MKGVNIIYLTNRSIFPRLLLLFLVINITIKFYLILKKNKYHLLIVETQLLTYYLTAVFSKLLGIRTIFVVANTLSHLLNDIKIPFRKLHYILHKIALGQAGKIVCISKGVRDDLINNFHIPKFRITTIYGGIDIPHIKRLLKKIVSIKIAGIVRKNYVVSFGRLSDRKNISSLLFVFKEVLRSIPNLHLVIIGKGDDKLNLEEITKKLKIKKNVHFLGFLDNPYPYIKHSKAFIFTSKYEGFGLTIIEAMTCGIPVISVDCPHGPREILDNTVNSASNQLTEAKSCKYGILTPQLNSQVNIQCTAKEIISLLQNRSKIRHYKSMSLVRSASFTLNRMGQRYNNIIKSLYT